MTGLLGGEQEVIASLLFIAASITDGMDGYLARRRGQITTMGILLDPLADKLLISAAFIVLVAFTPAIVAALDRDRGHWAGVPGVRAALNCGGGRFLPLKPVRSAS